MDEISGRIVQVIKKTCNGNRSEFARRINITPAYAAQIYSGARIPSDRTISDICRVFNVNETWLRTGEGEMHTPRTKSEELAAIFAEVQISDDARARLVKAFATLPDEAYPKLCSWIQAMAEKLQEQE